MRIGWRVGVTVGAAVAVLAGAAAVGYLVDRSGVDDAFVIERFDQDIVVDPSGRLEVTETIDVHFSESRRGIFRDLPYAAPAGSVSYTFFSADAGAGQAPWPVIQERERGLLRLRIGDVSTWLDPGAYTYRLRYDLRGAPFEVAGSALAGEPRAEVRVDVPGATWPTEVQETRLRISGPADVLDVVCVQGVAGSVADCGGTPSIDGDTATITIDHLEPGRTGTVAVFYPAEAFTTPLPTGVDIEPLGSSGGRILPVLNLPRVPAAVLLALLFALPFALSQLVRGLVVYRDQETDPTLHDRQHPTAIPAPPDGMRPVEVAGLLLRATGSALFLSTLVDLDQRGAIRATRSEDGGDTTLTVVAGDPSAIPSEVDARFLGELQVGIMPLRFDGKYEASTSERVSSASTVLSRHGAEIFRKRGLLHTRGAWLNSVWFRILETLGVVLYLLVVGWLATRATTLSVGAVVAVGGVVLVGLLFAMAPWRHHRLPLNSRGRDTVARARAFREYVASVESEQLDWAAGQPGIDHLHPAVSLLPYAIVLGLADSWYARFGEVIAELAARAPAAAAAGGAAWWATQSSFRATSEAQSASTTAPSSSGGAGGGGGGAGSGAGGGGGGSW